MAVVYGEYVWHDAVHPLNRVGHRDRKAPVVVRVHRSSATNSTTTAAAALGTAQVRVRHSTIHRQIRTEILCMHYVNIKLEQMDTTYVCMYVNIYVCMKVYRAGEKICMYEGGIEPQCS